MQTLDLEGIDVAKESIVQGTILRSGSPVAGAYVRLLDSTGEFTAEVQTSSAGAFRFFAAPGDWTLRVLTPGGGSTDAAATATLGEVAELTIEV